MWDSHNYTTLPLRPVTGIDLLLYVDDVHTSQEAHLYNSTAYYRESFTFLSVDDVCTSLEAYASAACYGDSVTFLCADDILTSQETYQSTSMARYRYSFTFLLLLYLYWV
jgi:hypothetical protein